MFRLLIIFLIFYIGYKLVKKFFFKNKNNDTIFQKPIEGEKIVPCKECKLYIPESKAVKVDGKIFCSKECVEKYLDK